MHYLTRRFPQAITDGSNGMDQWRNSRHIDFCAKKTNENIENVIGDFAFSSPDGVQEMRAADHAVAGA